MLKNIYELNMFIAGVKVKIQLLVVQNNVRKINIDQVIIKLGI